MKRFASILLLLSLLFNWFGYTLVSGYLQYKSDTELEAMLDHKAYDDQHLLAVKIPLHLPYLSGSGSFERVDGEIVVDGMHYKYVKRRICNDSLVLLCLPNNAKEKLLKAKDEYFQLVNGISHSMDGKAGHKQYSFFKNCLNDYYPETNNYSLRYFSASAKQYARLNCRKCTFLSNSTPEQPPES